MPGALGPRIGKAVQQVIGAVKKGEWTQAADGTVTAAGIELLGHEFTLRLVAADADRSAALPANAGIVVLDTVVTPELEAEGLARDLVRAIQQARRDAGLQVSDRIDLTLVAGPVVIAAAQTHLDLIARETLATDVALTAADIAPGVDAIGVDAPGRTETTVGDDLAVRIGIVKA